MCLNMNITNLAILKKLFGNGGSGASAYTVSSVDELPSNALDGSMAIAKVPHKLLGTWVFEDVVSPMPFRDFKFNFESNGSSYNAIYAYGSLQYGYSDGRDNLNVWGSDTLWLDPRLQTITITSTGTDGDELHEWLLGVAIQIECGDGYKLYVRENGEWVYKCEFV